MTASPTPGDSRKRLAVDGLELRRSPGFCLGPLSFELPAGTRTALVGPSGSGKTTLLRCLAGLEEPDAGTIRIGDEIVHGGRRPVPAERRGIGFVFQDGGLWSHMTARQHLTFVAPHLDRNAIDQLLDAGGLLALAERRPAEMSGGEARRLGLLRALAGQPDVLLLDEPLHSVDVDLRDELALWIRHQVEARGLTMLVVTHDREEALALAERAIVLRDGRVIEAGDTFDILARPQTAFAASFLGGATCLPAPGTGNGRVLTPFGALPAPADRRGALSLVLLPGDVVVGPGGPRGRVLQVRPLASGLVAIVEIDGHSLAVPCPPGVQPGQELELALRSAPRLLPEEEAEQEGTR